ncbi:hypothetical protein A8144_09765 [Mycobacterium leprae 3125609]|nr:hypothetical protein A8144_09765 [Mycobacterium leprae 3125609]OAX70833.1 hypothetical protein A3216_09550 [Mycobacterium leprae 7935681]
MDIAAGGGTREPCYVKAFSAKSANGTVQHTDIIYVAVDEDRHCGQQQIELPYSTSSAVKTSLPMEIVPEKLWCSPLAP